MLAANLTTVKVFTNHGHGSGVVVSDHCVLTADHVTAGAAFIKAETVDGSFIPLLVQQHSALLDLAYLCTNVFTFHAIAKWADKPPQQYDPVFIDGYPFGTEEVITTGLWQKHNIITAPAAPGNSGGPVFNAAGELVGIVNAILYYKGDGDQEYVFPHLCKITDMGVIRDWIGVSYGKA